VPAEPAPPLTVACAGVPIAAIEPADAVRRLIELAQRQPSQRRGVDVHLCNAYTLAVADADAEYRAMLQRASLNLPDGTPIVWANRLLHRSEPVPHTRVRGPGLFEDTFEAGQSVGLRHYLLGSTPATLTRLTSELSRRFPEAVIAGAESPPFRALSDDERRQQARRIAESGAEIVWVGLGTPKQDWECARLREELPLVFVAVGAAFDFTAGTVGPAPKWMQDNGLEWAHRFASEPGRLWKRYVFGNARFVKAAALRRDLS
jgi:N-acetylglucosaminyldiphosphoundecaprenol N-acetyl-beta-D-mannosaminyltransferase